MSEETPTLEKALRVFKENNKPPTTAEIGLRLGIPEDYNKSDRDLLSEDKTPQ
jgi:hypothetical protein